MLTQTWLYHASCPHRAAEVLADSAARVSNGGLSTLLQGHLRSLLQVRIRHRKIDLKCHMYGFFV